MTTTLKFVPGPAIHMDESNQDFESGDERGRSGDSLRFERRESDRWKIDGVATAFELGGERFGQMHTLRTIDYSDSGLGAFSDSALLPGTSISLGFQAPGYLAKRGTVIRSTPCGEGYRIAIAFEHALAA